MGNLPKEARAKVWINEDAVAAGVVDSSTVYVDGEWRRGTHPGILAQLRELPPPIDDKLANLETADGSLRIVPKAMLEKMHKLRFADGTTSYERAVQNPEEYLDPAISPALTEAQEYAEAILRADIAGFDTYSVSERATWVIQTMKRVNNIRAAIEDLGHYVARAKPGSTTKRQPMEDLNRAVWAAILKEVHGLSSLKIGERLGIPGDPGRAAIKGENQNANAAVARGREILHRAFTDAGWQERVKRMRAARPASA